MDYAFADLSDVKGDVYFGRTGLAAGRQPIVIAIEVHQAFGHGFDLHDIFWANRFAGTAADTVFCHHDRVAFGAHLQCIELTGINTVAHSDASNATFPLASGQSRLCSAAVDSEVNKFICSAQTATAGVI